MSLFGNTPRVGISLAAIGSKRERKHKRAFKKTTSGIGLPASSPPEVG